MTEFAGFGAKVQTWFTGLEADNSRDYFTAHKSFFESSIRDQVEALLEELSEQFGGEVKVFRQHRDVRFSADKSPYKTNTYGIVHGAEIAPAGLYASISAAGLVAGSGYHVMARDQLDRYRDAVAGGPAGTELGGLLADAEQAGLEVWGARLATAPRGYPKDHEQIGLLRYKTLTLVSRLPIGRGIGRDSGLEFVATAWRRAAPVTGWLERNVGPSTMPADRSRRPR